VLDATHSDAETMALLVSYFIAKTAQDPDASLAFFAPDALTYSDAPLGWAVDGKPAIHSSFASVMPSWGEARSYPTAVLGSLTDGSGSLVVRFTNTPGIVGDNLLHVMAAVDVRDSRFVRWVDYWDTSELAEAFRDQVRASEDSFPTSHHEDELLRAEHGAVGEVAAALHQALAKGEAGRAAALFDADATFTDLALRTHLLGGEAIGTYVQRSLDLLPFGRGAGLRHVLGSGAVGGYEWLGAPGARVPVGITSLVLTDEGLIGEATTVYDGRELSPPGRDSLIAAATTPWGRRTPRSR